MEHRRTTGRGVAVVALLVVGAMLLIRSHSATSDAVQCTCLLLGGLGVGAAALFVRDSVLKP